MVSELTKIAVTHLYVQGFRDDELVNFSLALTSPSTLYEQEKISLWTDKIALADSITNSKMLSRHWVYTNILNISEDEIEVQMEKITEEVKILAELEKMQQNLSAPAAQAEEGVPGEAPVDGGGDGWRWLSRIKSRVRLGPPSFLMCPMIGTNAIGTT